MRLTTSRHSERGIAIVIVMVCVFVLAALAGVFAAYMKVETRLAMNSNNEVEMQWMGRSGVELARYVLGQQLNIPGQPYDALNQKWAGGDCETNDLLAAVMLKDVEIGDGASGGKFSVTITDAERKFNINLALGNDAALQQALILIGTDAAEVPTMIASIQDWIDRDDNTHVNGAESEYYRGLDPAYESKNGPIDDMTELLFIKGITPEIYWGPNSTNHPTEAIRSRSPLRSGLLPITQVNPVGLVDIFTAISSGRINLNTASSSTLQMIPGVDANIAAAIIRLRSGSDGVDGTCDDVPLRSVGDLINVINNPVLIQQLSQFCDVRSSTFEVQVDVEVGQSKRRYYALLKRNSSRDVQILTFRWE